MKETVLELKKDDFFKPGENVYIQIDRNSMDYDGVTHKHQFIEVVYVISGKAVHLIGGNEYPVEKGNIIVINYGVPHAFTMDNKTDEPFLTYDLLFTPDFFDLSGIDSNDFGSLASSYLFHSLFPESFSAENSLNLIKSNSGEFHEIFKKVYREYRAREKGFMNIIRASLIELITKIFREIDVNSNARATDKQQQLVEKAISYLMENYNEHINLDNIVSDIFLSKNYFRQVFKNTTGISITSFIQKMRVEEACRLLRNTDRSISDISFECGFNDTKYFYNTFKKITGLTPGDFRKNSIT